MKDFPFGTIKVVNLTDFFLTREEHGRAMRQMSKKINGCQGAIIAAYMLVVGLLIGAVAEQNKKIDRLEELLTPRDETAG